ncbi:MAG TPA: tetratricopeptide repeat protein [Kofleriaceae bacterium]|nr:tetratricopeptide repeat protein [Kofleriaceae bacterium]
MPAEQGAGGGGSLARGTTVHRYVLLDEIGAGGMGVVYAAYDHGLDRKIALKFVRDPARALAHRRILREAHALAQLSHPNVVTVFDVGTYRDQLFVAMEFVAGQTLRSWLTGARRTWREVIEVFRRAGEGLAAAHAAGIVHRDFKPDNVLIDRDGRVRVGDFGLALIERDEPATGGDGFDDGEGGAARIESGPLGAGSASRVPDDSAARPPPSDPSDPRDASDASEPRVPSEPGEPLHTVEPDDPRHAGDPIDQRRAGDPRHAVEPSDPRHGGDPIDERHARDPRDPPHPREPRTPRTPPVRGRGSLTATGAAIGTPAYMAPEQHAAGASIDARADQFAFCVSLHEALFGERPFGDEETPDLAERFVVSAMRPAPRDRQVPAWLRRILRRGLARDAGDRYPSMDALLADVDRELGARRRRVLAAAIAGSLLAAAALVTVARPWQGEEIRCRSAPQRLAGVWDARERAAVRAAFRAADPAGAGRALPQIEPELDRYARSWVAMHTESCEATHVRGEQSEATLDLRTQCLDQRLAGMRALVDLLRKADRSVVAGAVQAVAQLEPIDVCADAAALREVKPPPDAAVRARVEALRGRLQIVKALAITGKGNLALEQGLALVADVRALHYGPLEADALATLGRIQRLKDKLDDAEETLYQAIAAGEASHNGLVTVRAWIDLLWVVGNEQMRFAEAERLGRVARGAIERLGGDPRAQAQLDEWLGVLYLRQGNGKDARAPLERALAAYRKQGLPEVELARPLRHLADLERTVRNHDQAIRLYRQSREIVEKAYGPDHPRVTSLLGSEGSILYDTARYDEALAIFERGLAAEERVVGPASHTAGTFLRFIGMVRWQKKEYDEAEKALRRSVSVMEKVFGPDSPYVGVSLSTLGELLNERKRHAEALRDLQRALAIEEKTLGADHPDLAISLARIGQAHLDSRHPERAIAPLERALRILNARGGAPMTFAFTRLELARALSRTHRERGRIRPLLVEARRGFEQSSEADDKKTAAHIGKWLASRRPVEPR